MKWAFGGQIIDRMDDELMVTCLGLGGKDISCLVRQHNCNKVFSKTNIVLLEKHKFDINNTNAKKVNIPAWKSQLPVSRSSNTRLAQSLNAFLDLI